ncbi:UNVERIFIED_CONTAM: hypothetical protein GTU68_055004 [Idotea baltica]|nr:hypothetical protein [Idotea baltica]
MHLPNRRLGLGEESRSDLGLGHRLSHRY